MKNGPFAAEVYSHLNMGGMRWGINPLAFQAAQPADAPELAAGDAAPPLAAGGHRGKEKGPGVLAKVRETPGPFMVGETGFEPVGTGCPKPGTAHAFRRIVSESGHLESTRQPSPVPSCPPGVPSSLGDMLETA